MRNGERSADNRPTDHSAVNLPFIERTEERWRLVHLTTILCVWKTLFLAELYEDRDLKRSSLISRKLLHTLSMLA